MEQYPITIDGENAGTLTVEQQGARTVFTAECAMRPELVRISVYGGGREGYLGVLAPEGGMLRLRAPCGSFRRRSSRWSAPG